MSGQKKHILDLDKCGAWFIIPNEMIDNLELDTAIAEAQ